MFRTGAWRFLGRAWLERALFFWGDAFRRTGTVEEEVTPYVTVDHPEGAGLMKRRSLIGRLYAAARLSAVCIANGLRGGRYCARREKLHQLRLWVSFTKQTVRDLASIFFHEIVPDPYESNPPAASCTVLFVPGYSMTANGASPLLSNIAATGCQVATCAGGEGSNLRR